MSRRAGPALRTPGRRGRRRRGTAQRALRGAETGIGIDWLRTLMRKGARPLERDHLRFQKREARAGILHCFALDCSGSMLAGQRLAQAKGLLLQLIQRAYQQRARIAIVSFAGARAQLRLAPTAARPFNSRALHAWLQPIGGGGGTPLAQGALRADALLARAAHDDPAQQRWLWLLTDGRSDALPSPPLHADVRIVVDCERQRIALGRCRALAQRWRAIYCTPETLADGSTFMPGRAP